jgi:hypothetical protein
MHPAMPHPQPQPAGPHNATPAGTERPAPGADASGPPPAASRHDHSSARPGLLSSLASAVTGRSAQQEAEAGARAVDELRHGGGPAPLAVNQVGWLRSAAVGCQQAALSPGSEHPSR